MLQSVVMLDEGCLKSGRGLRNYALSLRSLRNMHSRPQSWKHFFWPMLCRRNMHLHCTCLSPMHFCRYSFIPFLSMRPPLFSSCFETGTEEELSENQMTKLMKQPVHPPFTQMIPSLLLFCFPSSSSSDPNPTTISLTLSDLSLQEAFPMFGPICVLLLHLELPHLPTMGTLVNSSRTKPSNVLLFSG